MRCRSPTRCPFQAMTAAASFLAFFAGHKLCAVVLAPRCYARGQTLFVIRDALDDEHFVLPGHDRFRGVVAARAGFHVAG